MPQEHRGSFTAVSASGRKHTINIYVNVITSNRLSGSTQMDGLKELQTDDGSPVNRISKGEYQIVTTGERLTSDAPNAP